MRRWLRWLTLSLLAVPAALAGCQAPHPGLAGMQEDFPALMRRAGEEPTATRAQKPTAKPPGFLELGPGDPGSRDARGARIRAVVNGEAILDEEVLAASYQYLIAAKDENERAEILNAKLTELIDREVILQDSFARLRGPGQRFVKELERIARREFEKQWLHKLMAANKQTDVEAFKKFLNDNGMPVDMVRRQWERNFIAMEFLRSRIEPSLTRIGHLQIAEFYDKHPEEFRVEDTVVWQDIFIATAKHPSHEAAWRFAEVLAGRVRRGEDFVRLAKEFDNGESVYRDNAAGVGGKRGEITPAQVEPVLFGMKKGDVALVEIPTGFHIVKLVERTYKGRKPFNEAVQKEIREKLRQQVFVREMKRIVNDLKRRAVIEVAHEIK